MVDDPERFSSGGEMQSDAGEYIRTAQPLSKEVLEMEFVYEALSHPRRRYIVYSLLSKKRWTLSELATKFVAWEREIPEEDVTDDERDEAYVSFYHTHVPKLVDLDIVEFEDGERDEVVVAAENAVQVLTVLEGVGTSIDTRQEKHARSDYKRV
jgi:hypothetical protein